MAKSTTHFLQNKNKEEKNYFGPEGNDVCLNASQKQAATSVGGTSIKEYQGTHT
jgi:hypothetical protein